MRIIKQEKEIEIICNSCESKLAYINSDIKYKSFSSVKFIPNGIKYIKCPICSNEIAI